MTVSDARLAQIAERFAQLEARLASGTLEGAEFVAASRDYSELEPVARAAASVREMRGAGDGFEFRVVAAGGDEFGALEGAGREPCFKLGEAFGDVSKAGA